MYHIYAMAQSKVKPFIRKLHEILEDPGFSSVIEWCSNDAFIIHHRDRLCRDILKKYFKTSSFDSFTRQLNKYDFKKQRNQDIFWNKNFVRNSENKMSKIEVRESFQTLRQVRENTLAPSLFNCKVIKALGRITDAVENLIVAGLRRPERTRVLIFEDFEPIEVVEILIERGVAVVPVFFYNDFEMKISSFEFDYLVIDVELLEIFQKMSSMKIYSRQVKIICTSSRPVENMNGIFKVLCKPYDTNQLCSLIK